jgi:hypothetical protein
MASIRLEGVFPAGRDVSFIPRKSHEMHVAARPDGIATVDNTSVVQIDGLKPGKYWASAAGQIVAVEAKGRRNSPDAEGAGAVESEPRDIAAIDEAPDPAPNHPKIVQGARDSRNTRTTAPRTGAKLKAAPKAPREPRAPRS